MGTKDSTAYEKIGNIVFKLNPKLKGIMISAVDEEGKEYPRVHGVYIKNKNFDAIQEKNRVKGTFPVQESNE